jgi:hypothetical protein
MPYGTIKVDNITFDNGGTDKLITVSGLFFSTSGALTVTGTISGGNVTAPTATFTTLTGITTVGTTATFTSGSFTSVTGTTVTGTTANFASGVFTTQISGASITGTTVTATTGNYTALTGVTTTGTTANFVTFNGASGVFTTRVSGTTVTGTTANFTSGNFTSLSGTTTTVTSGVFSAGSATAPSVAVGTGTSNAPGIYSPGTDQLAISTSGTGRLFVDASGNVGVGGAASAWQYTAVSVGFGGSAVSSDAVDKVQLGANFYRGSGADRFTGTGFATLYQQNAGAHAWFRSSASGTAGNAMTLNESMRIDSSGNVNIDSNTFYVDAANNRVGIGTTSPSGQGGQKLTVSDGSIAISNSTSAGNNGELRFIGRPDGVNYNWAGIRAISDVNINQGILAFFTSASNVSAESSTERMRIDTSGRLLVGTSTNTNHIRSGQKITAVAIGGDYSGINTTTYAGASVDPAPIIDLQKSRGSTDGSLTSVISGDVLGYLQFRGADGAKFVTSAEIKALVDGTPGTDDMPGRLVFSTTADGAASPTPRMQIGSTGQSLFFTASTSSSVITRNGAAAGTSVAFLIGAYSATGLSDGTNSFIVWTNGNVVNTNNSYGSISDIKLKENIVDANSQWDDLKALQVRKYNFKEGQTHTQIGLVAQEVELVSPGLVSESPDRDAEGNDLGTVTKSVNYSVLYMKAVKALQEAIARIESLETRLSALEGA